MQEQGCYQARFNLRPIWHLRNHSSLNISGGIMGKSQDSKKEGKKKPAKSLKEKRKDKQEKRKK